MRFPVEIIAFRQPGFSGAGLNCVTAAKSDQRFDITYYEKKALFHIVRKPAGTERVIDCWVPITNELLDYFVSQAYTDHATKADEEPKAKKVA